jgi:cell division protease FtsH
LKDLRDGDEVKALYEHARILAPTIVYIEDLDFVASNRDVGYTWSVLSELLNQIEGIETNKGIFTIATTNRPAVIEKALAERPGRIDRRVAIGLPNKARRKQILRIHFGEKIKLDPSIDVGDLLRRTEGFTGGHIHDLVHTATVEALKDVRTTPSETIVVKRKHIETALVKIKKEAERYKDLYV